MKPLRVLALVLLLPPVAAAQGSGALLKQVQDSSRAAAQVNQQREARFAAVRDQEAARLRATKAELAKHEARVATAKRRWEAARGSLAGLEKKIKDAGRDLEVLYDATRGAAVDLHDTATRSLITPQFPDRIAEIAPIAASQTSPGPAELEALWRALLQEMHESGQVARFDAAVAGEEAPRRFTRIGAFSVTSGGDYYALAPDARSYVRLPRQPERALRDLAEEFESAAGLAPALLDPTRGPLLQAEAMRPGLFERLWQSGVGGYFIAGIAGLALLLLLLQPTVLRSRLLLDEHSIAVVTIVLAAFALAQWWFWTPRDGVAEDEQVAMVDLVEETPPPPEDEPPPPPDIPPPPPPPEMPTPQAETALAGLPALAAPTVAPLVSNLSIPVKIAGGGSLTGLGFAGFARGSGMGAGTDGVGRGKGFSGKPLVPLSTARPQMPEWACKQGLRGWVEAVFTVRPDGRVQDVKIVDAQPRGVYEMAAVDSISNWIYAENDTAREVKQRVEMDPADCAYNWR